MNYTAQLKAEGNLLRRPEPKGKAPRKRIRKVSAKRAKDMRVYSVRRVEFLEKHMLCEMPWGVRRDGNAGLHFSETRSCDVHHRFKRGKFYLDESTWMAVCRPCHDWIHAHPSEARTLGLLL